jgi:hypothetical protein
MFAEEIKNVVSKIREDYLNGVAVKDLEERYSDFYTFNRSLFELVASQDFSEEIFNKFMHYKTQLENGRPQYDVDVELGEYMAEKYIPQNLLKKRK